MNDYVIMPREDYVDICDAVRERTAKSGVLRSGDVAGEIRSIPSGGGGGEGGTPFSAFISGTAENVAVPYGATAVRNYACFKNSSIRSISIPETVTYIGVESLRECPGLTSVEIPASVETVSYRAFWYDSGLTTVVFKGTPNEIKNDAFLSSGVLDIYVPWAEHEVNNAPWGAVNATIHYETEVGE